MHEHLVVPLDAPLLESVWKNDFVVLGEEFVADITKGECLHQIMTLMSAVEFLEFFIAALAMLNFGVG